MRLLLGSSQLPVASYQLSVNAKFPDIDEESAIKQIFLLLAKNKLTTDH
jgi:hypothetical protein